MSDIKNIFVLISLFLITGCEKEMLNNDISSDVPVVEAYLYPMEIPKVELTHLITYTDESTGDAEPLSGIEIFLVDNEIEYLLIESNMPGIYIPFDSGFYTVEGDSYDLQFNYNDKLVTASSEIPIKPTGFAISSTSLSLEKIEEGENGGFPNVDNIELYWENTDETYHIISIANIEDNPELVNDNLIDIAPKTSSTTNPIVIPGHTLNQRDIAYFGTYRIVLFKINQEYADLYEITSQSSVNLTNPLTNIENGWGIFTGINSDTLYLEVNEI